MLLLSQGHALVGTQPFGKMSLRLILAAVCRSRLSSAAFHRAGGPILIRLPGASILGCWIHALPASFPPRLSRANHPIGRPAAPSASCKFAGRAVAKAGSRENRQDKEGQQCGEYSANRCFYPPPSLPDHCLLPGDIHGFRRSPRRARPNYELIRFASWRRKSAPPAGKVAP